ncbi:MAG: hypothetical protein NZ703_02245 [Gemmataceae bacterium]|nr:hypothetical protein [Gemmataceae bacterium]
MDSGGWTVTLTSPQTAFALFSLRPEARDIAQLADETLAALQAEYAELDAEDRVETVAGQMAIGHDIDFVTIDTLSVCWTRCLETPAGPLLTLRQVSEYDRRTNEPVLHAILASLTVDDD